MNPANNSGEIPGKLELRQILILAHREVLNALRNRWFITFAVAFAALALGLSWLGLAGVGKYGLSGFGKTTASLINLVLFLVPLTGLVMGATNVAGERENDALLFVMSQPVSLTEVLLGKFLGIGAALAAALLIGFGISGYVIALKGGTAHLYSYFQLIGFTLALALCMLSLGLLLAMLFKRAESAIGISIFVWLLLVVVSDMALVGSVMFFKLHVKQLFALSLFNPLQVFRLGALIAIRGSLEILGPVGTYAMRSYGSILPGMLFFLLALWTAVFLTAAGRLSIRRGAV